MYSTLLILHSIFRWLVLIALLISIYRASIGYFQKRIFTSRDHLFRHWTATIAHIQLVIGMLLYLKSPIVKFFWKNKQEAMQTKGISFFSIYHVLLMFGAIVLITIGSAFAKRKHTDSEKHQTMLIWYGIALLIILIAIPWPFSPFANRTYIRY